MGDFPDIPESELYGRTWDERQAFLRAASECRHIRLSDALRKMVYGLVLKTPPEHYTDQFSAAAIAWRADLHDAMVHWAKRFNLGDIEWVIPMAWEVINLWQCARHPTDVRPFTSVRLYAPPPKFDWPHWTGNTSERDYRNHVDNTFSRALESYIAACKEGRAKDPPLVVRTKHSVEVRYTWAALRVCLKWPYCDIAEQYGGSESVSDEAVRKMVAGICERIGIPI